MFGSKTAIYVSIGNGYEYVQHEKRHRLKPRHTWMLSLEPRTHQLGGKRPHREHYSATWDIRQNRYELHPVSGTNFGIVGSVRLTKSAQVSSERIAKLLEQGLDIGYANSPAEQTAVEGPEHWIRAALNELQIQGVIFSFDVDEFIAFAHRYVAKRLDPGSGILMPAIIPYPRIDRVQARETKENRFWITYPATDRSRCGSRVYGGLM